MARCERYISRREAKVNRDRLQVLQASRQITYLLSTNCVGALSEGGLAIDSAPVPLSSANAPTDAARPHEAVLRGRPASCRIRVPSHHWAPLMLT